MKYIETRMKNKLNDSKFKSEVFEIINDSIDELIKSRQEPLSEIYDITTLDKDTLVEFYSSTNEDLLRAQDMLSNTKSELEIELNNIKQKRSAIRNNIIKNSNLGNSLLNESFNSYDNIDMNISNNLVDILTKEGLCTLKCITKEDINIAIKDLTIDGNGEAGNNNLIFPITKDNKIEYYLLNDVYKCDDVNAIRDKDSKTWFIYQSLLKPINLNITFDFSSIVFFNWIEISPYIPTKSHAYATIADDLLSSDYIINKKYDNVKTLSLDFTQNEKYEELLGDVKYYINSQEIDTNGLPAFITNGPIGIYEYGNKVITKVIIKSENKDRYAIGIRDISLYYKTFETISSFTTKEINIKDFRSIYLKADIDVPNEILNIDSNVTEWIKFEISLNKGEWKEIIPNNLILTNNTKPRIFRINSLENQEIRDVDKFGYLETLDKIKKVVLRVTLKRPQSLKEFSPILKNYELIGD